MLATNCDLCWLAISSSRLFWAISSNRRAFSSAMADWSAKVCMRLTTACGNSPGWRRRRTSAPSGPSAPSRGTMRDARKPASSTASRKGSLGRLSDVWNLQWLPLGDRLAKASLSLRDVKLAEPCNDLLVEPRRLAELEGAKLLAVVEYRCP